MSDPPPPDHPDGRPPFPGAPAGSRLDRDESGAGPPVVLAHGFTQTRRVWGGIDRRLASRHRVVRVDLPGHGGSSDVRAGVADGAALLVEAGGRGAYVGYSMGARHCLRAALDHPSAVTSLVLISGTAGLEDPAEREARRTADEALADDLDPPTGGPALPVEVFVRRWLAGPLFAGLGPGAAATSERLTNTGAGLAASLRLAGTGTQEPLWDRLGELAVPVLIVTGGEDTKFTALGRRLAGTIGPPRDGRPGARHLVVPHAGHAPHLQQPDEVARRILDHLAGPAAAG